MGEHFLSLLRAAWLRWWSCLRPIFCKLKPRLRRQPTVQQLEHLPVQLESTLLLTIGVLVCLVLLTISWHRRQRFFYLPSCRGNPSDAVVRTTQPDAHVPQPACADIPSEKAALLLSPHGAPEPVPQVLLPPEAEEDEAVAVRHFSAPELCNTSADSVAQDAAAAFWAPSNLPFNPRQPVLPPTPVVEPARPLIQDASADGTAATLLDTTAEEMLPPPCPSPSLLPLPIPSTPNLPSPTPSTPDHAPTTPIPVAEKEAATWRWRRSSSLRPDDSWIAKQPPSPLSCLTSPASTVSASSPGSSSPASRSSSDSLSPDSSPDSSSLPLPLELRTSDAQGCLTELLLMVPVPMVPGRMVQQWPMVSSLDEEARGLPRRMQYVYAVQYDQLNHAFQHDQLNHAFLLCCEGPLLVPTSAPSPSPLHTARIPSHPVNDHGYDSPRRRKRTDYARRHMSRKLLMPSADDIKGAAYPGSRQRRRHGAQGREGADPTATLHTMASYSPSSVQQSQRGRRGSGMVRTLGRPFQWALAHTPLALVRESTTVRRSTTNKRMRFA